MNGALNKMKMKRILIFTALAAFFFASAPVAQAQSKNFTMAKWVEVYNAILRELNRSYVDSLEVGRIQRAAVDAMLGALDPYTIYVPQEEQEDFQMMLTNTYGGVGAVIYKPDVNGNVIINEPYANSPAAKAGLRCGDEVEAIDGVSTHGLTSSESSERMRGKPGTTVAQGQEPCFIPLSHCLECGACCVPSWPLTSPSRLFSISAPSQWLHIHPDVPCCPLTVQTPSLACI